MKQLYVVIVSGNKTYPMLKDVAESIAKACGGVVVKAQEEDLVALNNLKRDKEF